MNKMIKLIGITLSLLLLAIGLIIVASLLLANPNQFKKQISQAITHSTGQTFSISGDIHWKIFPKLSLQIHDAKLGSQASSQSLYAKISELTLQIQLLPLIKHKFLIDTINIHGVAIYLAKKSIAKTYSNPANSVDITAKASPYENPTFFSITNIHIDNADVYRSGEDFPLLQHLQLDSQNITLGQEFPIKLQGMLSDKNFLRNLTLSGLAKLNPEQQTYQLSHAIVLLAAPGNKNHCLQIKAEINLNKSLLKIAHLQGDWNTSHLQGKAEYNLAKKQLNLDLNLDKLTFNQQQESAHNAANATHNNTNWFTAPSLLEAVSVTGNIKIARLKIAKFNFQQVIIPIHSANKNIFLGPIQAQGYGGNIAAKLNINTTAPILQLNLDANLNNIQAQSLTQDLKENSKLKLSGVGNLKLQGLIQGSQLDSLNGSGQFIFKHGLLKGVDIPYYIGIGQALIKKQPLPTQTNSEQTDFGTLTGTFTIRQGIIYNNDFALTASQLKVRGNGFLNLVNQLVDFHLLANRIDNVTKNESDTIPIAIQGSFNHPRVQPDMQAMIKLQLQKQLKKVGDKLGDSLKDQLKQLNFDFLFK